MQRKRRKKKRFGVFLFLLVVCIGIGIMFVPWAMQPENFREVKNKINGFLYKEDFPDSYNAKSLILVDCSDDEIFVSKNENEPQIPASLAKLFVIEYASTLADLDSIVVADWCYFTHETRLVCCSNQGKRILFTQSICGNVSTVRE